jgi:predicted transcriptional regulator
MFVILSLILLLRHRKLVSDFEKSNQLAKNLWDALEFRLKKQDERIIDLMVKLEVYSVKASRSLVSSLPNLSKEMTSKAIGTINKSTTSYASRNIGTEGQILNLLVEGPKTSIQIKESIGKTREHIARLMKVLFENGLVIRNDKEKPFVYQITQRGRDYLLESESARR